MNFNGGTNTGGNFSDGGNQLNPPSGLLTINEDLKVMNDLEVVGTIISNIEVKDAIISINRDAPADTNNSGMFSNNTNNTKFSGLIRNKTDKAFYLFNNITTLPTATGTISDRNGTLLCGDINSPNATFGAIGAQYSVPATTSGKNANDVFVYNGAGSVSIERPIHLYSPNGLQHLQMSNTISDFTDNGISRLTVQASGPIALYSPNGGSMMSLTNNLFQVETGGSLRIYTDGTTSQFLSPLDNTGFTCQDGQALVNVDGSNHMSFTPTYDTWQLGGGYGFALAGDTSYMYDQSGNTAIQLSGIAGIYNGINFQTDGGLIRGGIQDSVNGDGSVLFKQLAVDTKYKQLDASIQLDVNAVNRLMLDGTDSKLSSPDGLTAFKVANANAKLTKGAQDRIIVDATGSTVASPSATSYNTITSSTAATVIGGIAREQHNASNTYIASPDGTKTLTLTNTNLTSNCPVVLSSIDSAGSLVIGTATATNIVIGRTGIATNINGFGVIANTLTASIDAPTVQSMNIGQSNCTTLTLSRNGQNTAIAGTSSIAGVLTLGTGATLTTLPNVAGSTGQVLKMTGANSAGWAQDTGYSVNFGGSVNTNVVRWMIPSSRFDGATSTSSDYSTRSVVPFDASIRALTYNTQSGTATTQIIVSRNGVDILTQLLGGASGVISSLNLAFTAGQYVEVRWSNVGTRPDNSQVRLFFS